jgi:hypothetical protein
MKKIIVRLFLIVVVLLIAALVAVFFSLNSIVKKGVETLGPQMTKVEVRLGSADISPLSGSGRLKKLFVGNPEGYKTPSAIQIGSVKVSVKIGSVLSDTIVVDEINIQAPEITLEGTLTGNNLSKILDNLNAVAGTEKPKTEAPAKKSEKKFIVKDIQINGGKVNVSLNMPVLGGKSLTVPLPPVHLQDIGKAENGVTSAQLVTAVMKSLLAATTEAATKAIADLGSGLKDVTKGGADELNKAAKGISDLFKKK